DAFFPSLVAVIVAVPAATPVARPVGDTVATDGFKLDHVIPRPASTVAVESFAVAVSCTVPPTRMFAALGAIRTETTGTLDTVTGAVPVCPSHVAVIVADPTATPLTRPLGDTVAIALLFVAHVTVRPGSTFPLASFATAVSC